MLHLDRQFRIITVLRGYGTGYNNVDSSINNYYLFIYLPSIIHEEIYSLYIYTDIVEIELY